MLPHKSPNQSLIEQSLTQNRAPTLEPVARCDADNLLLHDGIQVRDPLFLIQRMLSKEVLLLNTFTHCSLPECPLPQPLIILSYLTF